MQVWPTAASAMPMRSSGELTSRWLTHTLMNTHVLPQALAVALQSRISELFAVDIHPAAQLGRGIMLDHATGIVIGETAVVGDNVSMLHHVSLGGSGTGRGELGRGA